MLVSLLHACLYAHDYIHMTTTTSYKSILLHVTLSPPLTRHVLVSSNFTINIQLLLLKVLQKQLATR